MAQYINASHGKLVFPDGTEFAHGDTVDVSAKLADNAAIAEWIKTGALVKPANFAKPAPPDFSAAEMAAAQEEIAALKAQVEKLTEDLEAATKPKAE